MLLTGLEFVMVMVFCLVCLLLSLKFFFISYSKGSSYSSFFIYISFCCCLNFLVFIMWDVYIMLVFFIKFSFVSLFLIMWGYGVSFDLCVLCFFKSLGDFLILMFMGSYLFFTGSEDFSLECSFYGFYAYSEFRFMSGLLIVLAFWVYSLCGICGFWMFWAMDASYYLSCVLHTMGFIFTFGGIFMSLYYSGELFFSYLTCFIIYMFVFGVVVFSLLFCIEKKMKKSLGFYSWASMSMCIIFYILSPSYSLFVMTISILYKVYAFEIMEFFSSVSNKLSKEISGGFGSPSVYGNLMFCILYGGFIIVFNLLGFSFHLVNFSFLKFFSLYVMKSSVILWGLGVIKLVGLFFFHFKVYNVYFYFHSVWVVIYNCMLFVLIFLCSVVMKLSFNVWDLGWVLFIWFFLFILFYYGGFKELSLLVVNCYMSSLGGSLFICKSYWKIMIVSGEVWCSFESVGSIGLLGSLFSFNYLDSLFMGFLLFMSFLVVLF